MAAKPVHPNRIKQLNQLGVTQGKYVLYWMQQSQRAEFNPALEYALHHANKARLPLLVGFGLMDGYPEATLRHYHFMLEGLRETQQTLRRRGILMVVRKGNPAAVALELGCEASMVFCDRGYLRHQKAWRDQLGQEARCQVTQIEGDVVVPVEVASDKAEIAARTLRPRIHRHLREYLVEQKREPAKVRSLNLDIDGIDLSDINRVLRRMKLDRTVPPTGIFTGGTTEAKKWLKQFVDSFLPGYAKYRNQPGCGQVSHMSKYLHFGQISPVAIALAVQNADCPDEDRESLLEELIVRRELAHNFVHYTENYDSYDCLPAWARATLAAHAGDPRPHLYTRAELEAAGTHDEYWNAAMKEMVLTGYMHNHMRMYWGKKILEWSKTPREGYETTLHLNNKYLLDGRDANSFSNVAWVFGQHDRPWPERAIFGKVRCMTAGGLESKTDIDEYVKQIKALAKS